MKKPQDVRLLIELLRGQYNEAMAAVPDDPTDADLIDVEELATLIALATFILDEPERACTCHEPDCILREWYEEDALNYQQMLDAARGVEN